MLKIKSKINAMMTWNIDTQLELNDDDISFIENLCLDIFHNDLTGKHWAFDTKLPSDKFLENITFTNGLMKINAIIL